MGLIRYESFTLYGLAKQLSVRIVLLLPKHKDVCRNCRFLCYEDIQGPHLSRSIKPCLH